MRVDTRHVWQSIAILTILNVYSPTISEIAAESGMSRAKTHREVEILEARGIITRKAGKTRTIVLRRWPKGLEPG